MILVTVGTPQQPFNRLVKVMDDFAAQTEETVVIQAGSTTYEPKHAKFFRWTTSLDMERLTNESRVVITQASAGAIILALKFGKPLIVVPRVSRYGEHYNDHQYQLALALQEGGQAIFPNNLTVAGLKEAIDHALNLETLPSSRESLVNGLKLKLNVWQRQLESKENG